MIYNSKFNFDLDFINRKNGCEWEFSSKINEQGEETIYFRPFKDNTKQGAWFFNGDADTSTEDTHDEYEWDQYNPWLEYNAENVEQWNKEHPNNLTRYLSAFTSFGTAISTIENVYIDTVAPSLIEWNKNSFTTINSNIKKVSLTVKEDSGLDFGCYVIKQVDGTILYKKTRKETPAIVTSDYIKKAPQFVTDNAAEEWEISFEIENLSDESLNKNQLVVEIWDIAGNHTEIVCDQTWKDYTLDEVSELKPLVITFYDKTPSNMIVETGSVGSVWVDIFNPNKDYRVFDIFFELDEVSEGNIDISTIDTSTYEEDGHIKFKIIGINDSGIVKVNAWQVTELNEEFDAYLKEATYAEAECGPWIVQGEGRIYHFVPQTPKVVQNSNFGEFLNYVELYLNTIYSGLDNNKRISALEKISRINDFNDIAKLEDRYLYHYASERGNEINLSIQEVDEFNKNMLKTEDSDTLSMRLIQKKEVAVNTKTSSKTEDEYDDAIATFRNVLSATPYYNKIKGTKNGMQMMLRMFGITCTIINLWRDITATGTTVEYVKEDDLDYEQLKNYFLTSRFNIDVSKLNTDFESFNKSINTLKKLVMSIKPINRLLNVITYTLKTYNNLYVNHFVKEITEKDTSSYTIELNNVEAYYESIQAFEHIYFSCNYKTLVNNKKYNNCLLFLGKKHNNNVSIHTVKGNSQYRLSPYKVDLYTNNILIYSIQANSFALKNIGLPGFLKNYTRVILHIENNEISEISILPPTTNINNK